jgi:Asp/Glu/hydantoin racemase
MLGRRFGVVSFTAALKPMFVDCLEHAGLANRCAGFRMGPAFAGDPGRVAEERRDMILELCRTSIEQDGAEVVILAGGPLAGLAPALAADVPAPLVDGTVAGVRMAAALAGLAPMRRAHRTRGLTGYEPGLTQLYAEGSR